MNYYKKFEGENSVCTDKFCNLTTRQGYFRITGYSEELKSCFILDSNGMFEKLWQFSAYLVQKGIKVIEVSKEEAMIDINIEKVAQDNEHIILRATADGTPEYIEKNVNGITYKAIKVADKIYIPDNTQII